MENGLLTLENSETEHNKQPSTVPITYGLSNPYIHLATSDNTRKAYQHDVRHYETWGGRLPATPEMIAHYLENSLTA